MAQSEPSRLNEADRLSSDAPSQIQEVEAPLSAAGSEDTDVTPGEAEPATTEVSDALKTKIRAIIALIRDEAKKAETGSELLGSRIRVRCAVKQVVSKRKLSFSATPALMLSEGTAAASKLSSTTVEACTVKLIEVRRNRLPEESQSGGKHAYSVELPPLDQSAP